MKILELRFKNLNSLVGEWCIDFADPAFAADGLFAITGPTGSGKTTILDALCLALYGQTPRLGKMTQSDNEVMSRQTGECFAEVLFETAQGVYRAHWHQQRARKKPAGTLQAPKREIANEQGTVLATKLRDVQERIDTLSGMSFDRFTRSILLAQGSFDTFLKASADERSPILEQITGTEIYSDISRAVHQRNSVENQKLNELKATLGGIQLLTHDELEQIQFDLKQVKETYKTESVKRDAAKAALDSKARIQTLEKELEANRAEQEQWRSENATFQPNAARLATAKRAQPLDVAHAKLVNGRNQRLKTEIELAAVRTTLPDLEEQNAHAEDALKLATEQLDIQKVETAKWAPILKAVRELDVQLIERATTLTKKEADLETQQSDLQNLLQSEQEHQEALNALQTDLAEVEAYQAAHAQDGELVGQLSGILQALEQLQQQASENDQAQVTAEAAKVDAAQAETRKGAAAEKLNLAQDQFSITEKALHEFNCDLTSELDGKTLSDWRTRFGELQQRIKVEQRVAENRKMLKTKTAESAETEKELSAKITEQTGLQREQTLLLKNLQLQQKIESLEAERNHLIDGQPCPLCGALEHPYATQLPESETRSIDQLNADLHNLSEIINQLTGIKSAAEVQCETLRAALVNDEAELLTLSSGHADDVDLIAARIATIEQLEQQQASAKAVLDQALELLNQQKLTRQTAEQAAQTASEKWADAERHKGEIQDALQQTQSALLQTLQPYGIENLNDAAEQLIARRDQWQTAAEQQTALKQTRSNLQTTLNGLAEQIKAQTARNTEHAEELKEQSAELNVLKADRNELFEDRQPDALDHEIQAALERARTANEYAQAQLTQCQKALVLAQQNIAQLGNTQREIINQLTEAEPLFIQSLTTADFENETAYLAARLSETEQTELEQKSDDLKQRHTRLAALEAEKIKQLQNERDQKHIETTPEEHAALVECCNEFQRQIGTFNNQLSRNEESLKTHQNKLGEIENQQIECTRWNTLHELIGSADGKKFRNFAQGLTFELMVSHANQQLTKMSDRYLLTRDLKEPLNLNVVDNYQAGEIRPTNNLSGGESFIVSLSLALGLSKMASKTVRVDSLFLDEGFGTLDEDALETALEALAELKQDGKLIGVISHVGALKERIGTQINVHITSGGRSRLSGTGISETTI